MDTIVAAVISGAFTLCVCLINNHFHQKKTRDLISYKLDELTKRVDKHNNVIERTYKLEGRMNEAEHDIRDMKQRRLHNEN